MDRTNRKRPIRDQEQYDSLAPSSWTLATVDDPDTWPEYGDYYHGCLHCSLLVPAADFLHSGDWEAAVPEVKFKFCRPWAGAGVADDFIEGQKVWVREYMGFNIVMLAEC